MSDAESRYYEAMEEMRHMRNCGLCLMGRSDLCTDDDEEDES